MAVQLRVYDAQGRYQFLLPEYESVTTSAEFCDVGSINIVYPRNGLNLDALLALSDATVSITEAGYEHPERWFVEDDTDDPADERLRSRAVNITGRGLPSILERAVVYPGAMGPNGTLAGAEPVHRFTKATPGVILRTLIQRAQERGALAGLDVSTFSSTHDSAGQPWPADYTVDYDAGRDYLALLRAMVESGWVEWRMRGMALDVYAPGTTLARDVPQIILRLGREVTAGPRKRTRRSIKSHVLLVGDEGAIVERSSPAALSQYGRREVFDGRGGITALDTLALVGDTVLEQHEKAREGFTLTYINNGASDAPRAGRDYMLGDYIRYDQRRLSSTAYDPLRVRSISRTYDSDAEQSVEIEVADLFVESQVALARRVDAILNGSTSNSRAPQESMTPDKVPPAATGNVSVTTNAYVENGRTVGTAVIGWQAVTKNEDGTIYDDFGGYYVSWWARDEGKWQPEQMVRETSTNVGSLTPGQRFQARVRAVDATGNTSGYTLSPIVTVQTDGTPPPVPSAPVVADLLSGMSIRWDGLGAAGEPMPADFQHVEVHVSADPAFVPTTPTQRKAAGFNPASDTLIDTLTQAATTGLSFPVGETRYVRLLSVDTTGNRSAPTAEVAGKSQSVLPPGFKEEMDQVALDVDKAMADAREALAGIKHITTDAGDLDPASLPNQSILGTKIANAAVGPAQLAVGAVFAQPIGAISQAALDTGAITSGSLTGDNVASRALAQLAVKTSSNPAEPAVVVSIGGSNQLPNSSFEDGLTGWGVEAGFRLAIGDRSLVHGTQSLLTTYDPAVGQQPALAP